jgi:hypothetical protein
LYTKFYKFVKYSFLTYHEKIENIVNIREWSMLRNSKRMEALGVILISAMGLSFVTNGNSLCSTNDKLKLAYYFEGSKRVCPPGKVGIVVKYSNLIMSKDQNEFICAHTEDNAITQLMAEAALFETKLHIISTSRLKSSNSKEINSCKKYSA